MISSDRVKIWINDKKRYFDALISTTAIDSFIREENKRDGVHYSDDAKKLPLKRKSVICTIDSHSRTAAGLSYRLKGILFAYNCVRELRQRGEEIDFRINFSQPFNLSDYLCPSLVDWRINHEEMSYNSQQAESIQVRSFLLAERGFSNRLTKIYLKRRIKSSECNQIHIHSFMQAPTDVSSSKLFNELFKPSPALQKELDAHYQILTHGGGVY